MTAGDPPDIRVPDSWSNLDLFDLGSVLMVIGAPDTGKSTLAHWLFERLLRSDRSPALLDGDVGQSALGPPTTLTLGMLPDRGQEDDRQDEVSNLEFCHWFVGDVSPVRHMLPLVVGAGRLAQKAFEMGAGALVVDTTGLVDKAQGGVALKHALVDQLQPSTLFALQRADELAPILEPLRHLSRPHLVELPVAKAVRRRDTETRRSHRARAFQRYFAGAGQLHLSLRRLSVFEGTTFAPRRLAALRDAAGFALALAVIVNYEKGADRLIVRTPLADARCVSAIHLSVLGVDPKNGREFRPGGRS
jgi:polynucleotide 5'-hydroxyl-kinase GRC3/NOL9